MVSVENKNAKRSQRRKKDEEGDAGQRIQIDSANIWSGSKERSKHRKNELVRLKQFEPGHVQSCERHWRR